MRRSPAAAWIAPVATILALASAACGSVAPDDKAGDDRRLSPVPVAPIRARPPYLHRAAPEACARTASPPVAASDPAAPSSSGDPVVPDAPLRDGCFTDEECPGVGVCLCKDGPSRPAHACTRGACRLDGDCGTGGFCSPSLDAACPQPNRIAGYFCHTPRDTCVDDGDCTTAEGEAILRGLCVHDATDARWRCSYVICSR